MGTPREVSEYGHFVFFLPIIEEPWKGTENDEKKNNDNNNNKENIKNSNMIGAFYF